MKKMYYKFNVIHLELYKFLFVFPTDYKKKKK